MSETEQKVTELEEQKKQLLEQKRKMSSSSLSKKKSKNSKKTNEIQEIQEVPLNQEDSIQQSNRNLQEEQNQINDIVNHKKNSNISETQDLGNISPKADSQVDENQQLQNQQKEKEQLQNEQQEIQGNNKDQEIQEKQQEQNLEEINENQDQKNQNQQDDIKKEQNIDDQDQNQFQQQQQEEQIKDQNDKENQNQENTEQQKQNEIEVQNDQEQNQQNGDNQSEKNDENMFDDENVDDLLGSGNNFNDSKEVQPKQVNIDEVQNDQEQIQKSQDEIINIQQEAQDNLDSMEQKDQQSQDNTQNDKEIEQQEQQNDQIEQQNEQIQQQGELVEQQQEEQQQNEDKNQEINQNEYTFNIQQKMEDNSINNKTSHFNNPDQEDQNQESERKSVVDYKIVQNKQINETKELLIQQIENGELESIKRLVSQFKIAPNEDLDVNGGGRTPLHFAAHLNKPEILEYFIFLTYKQHPLNFFDILNIQTENGNSCLMTALEAKSKECFEMLMQYGGHNLILKNKNRENAYDICQRTGQFDIGTELNKIMQILEITVTNQMELEKNCPSIDELILDQKQIQDKKQASIQRKNKNNKFYGVQKDQKSQSVSHISKQNLKNNENVMSPGSSQGKIQKQRQFSAKSNHSADKFTEEKIKQFQIKKKQLEKQMLTIDQEIGQLKESVHIEKTPNISYNKRQQVQNDEIAHMNAQNLLHKMKLQKKERELKKMEEGVVFRQKMLQEVEQSKQRKMELKQQLMKEKQDRINEKIQQQRKLREEQQKFNLKANQVIKELKMNQQLEDKQKHEIEMPELERRKQKLAEKRQIYQPINHQEILEHAKKHDKDLQLKMLENQKQRMMLGQELPNERLNNYKPQKSSFTNKILEQQKLQKEKEQKEQEEKRKMLERRKKYGELVKDIYQPLEKIDAITPQQQMQLMRQKEKPKMFRYHLKKKDQQDNMSHFVDQSVNNDFASNKSNPDPNVNIPTQTQSSQNKYQQQNLKNKQMQQQSSASYYNQKDIEKQQRQQELKKKQEENKNKNYIDDLRKMRKLKNMNQNQFQQENWNKYLNDDKMDMAQKYTNVMQSAQRIESLAQMKENSQQQDQDLENLEKINNLYVDSIKAKLALLDKIKDNN